MKIPFYLIFLFCIVFHFSCTSHAQKINGLSFVASRDSITTKNVKPIIKTNSNYVSLMPFAFLQSTKSPEVRFNFNRQWFGETDKGLKQYAKVFHNNGIKIMVKPQIWVSRGEYTGYVEMQNEEDWKMLESTYTKFIVTFASIAEEINAEIFCIGTELQKFVEQRPHFWKNLIEQIRKVYNGKLTYAANWDEYKRIQIWRDLDFIGIDAYFPITESKTPTIQEFEEGWKPHKKEIYNISKDFNKPIIFTEYGYRSVDYAGRKPWESNRIQGQVNLQAQANGLQAIHNQFWKEEWFAGGFVWKWFLNHEKVGGTQNNRFTPQNKPAEELLEKLHAN